MLFVKKYIKDFYTAAICTQSNKNTTCCVLIGLGQKATKSEKIKTDYLINIKNWKKEKKNLKYKKNQGEGNKKIFETEPIYHKQHLINYMTDYYIKLH